MRKSLKPILLLIATILWSIATIAQIDTTWIKTYGGNRDDKAFDIIQSNDDGFLVIGSTSSFGFDNSQMYFLKLDSTGAIMWSKSHGGTGQESGQSVIQTSDGGYFGVGYTNSWGAGGFDFFMVKLDSNGNLEYEDYYGGSDWDFAWDVVEVAPNEYVIAGETQSYGAGGKDGWIIKYNGQTRTVEWDQTVGNTTHEYFKSVTLGENDNLVAVGGGIQNGHTDEDVMVSKFNPLGDTIWNKFYGDTLQDYANDVIWMSDGSYSLTGLTEKVPYQDILVLQVDSIGQEIFYLNWGHNSNRIGNKITEIDSARIAIVGTIDISNINTDMFYAYSYPSSKYYQGGNTLGDSQNETGNSFVYLGDQGTFILGSTNGYTSSFMDIILFKTDKYGDYNNANFYSLADSTNISSTKDTYQPLTSILHNSSNNTITNSSPDLLTFSILSIEGRVLYQGTLYSNEELFLNRIDLETGLYLMYFSNKKLNATFVKKFIIPNN